MLKLPNIASNLKCWRTINQLVFGRNINCPVCTNSMAENYKLKYLWCSACRKKYRPTAFKGSWLYGTKLSSKQLFLLIWCWQNKKSPDTACLLVQASYTTVRRWYRRFRDHLPDCREILNGVVQVDESYFGKLKSKQDQLIVVGAIEQEERKIKLSITNSRSREAIEGFVINSIRTDSLVVSDKWYAYDELHFFGYYHESWNHSKGHFAGTNQIEGLWSIIKRYLRKLYGCVPTNNLEPILNEFMARMNKPILFKSPETYLKNCLFHFS